LSESDFVPIETNESDTSIYCEFLKFETRKARAPAVETLIPLGGSPCPCLEVARSLRNSVASYSFDRLFRCLIPLKGINSGSWRR
jgi:hypothetical protein